MDRDCQERLCRHWMGTQGRWQSLDPKLLSSGDSRLLGEGRERGVCGQREEGECGQAGFSSAPRTVPAHGCTRSPWLDGGWHPHLQDAPPLVLLVLGEHVSGEEGVAVEADAVGPVAVIFELSPVVGAPGTHHLREEGRGPGLPEAGGPCCALAGSGAGRVAGRGRRKQAGSERSADGESLLPAAHGRRAQAGPPQPADAGSRASLPPDPE